MMFEISEVAEYALTSKEVSDGRHFPFVFNDDQMRTGIQITTRSLCRRPSVNL